MMNTMIDPSGVEPVETALMETERPAVIVTTLYGLIATIQDLVATDDALVVATVRHILDSGRAIWCDDVVQCPS